MNVNPFDQPAELADQMISVKQEISDTVGSDKSSADLISDMLQSNNNYFSDIEEIAENVSNSLDFNLGNRLLSMINYLVENQSFPQDSNLASIQISVNFRIFY